MKIPFCFTSCPLHLLLLLKGKLELDEEEDEEEGRGREEEEILAGYPVSPLSSTSIPFSTTSWSSKGSWRRRRKSCQQTPFCFRPSSSSSSSSVPVEGIRPAGAGGPGRPAVRGRSSSGLLQHPAGQQGGTASSPLPQSSETKPHGAQTRSQRWAYPVERRTTKNWLHSVWLFPLFSGFVFLGG